MKWIKLYEEFTNDSMQDMITDALEKEIKDAIEKNGHFSAEEYYKLTKSRKLDDRMADEIFHDLVGRGVSFGDESEQVFEDGYFRFTLENIEPVGDETYYWGILECPDFTYGGEEDEQETIPGKFHGCIVAHNDGQISPEFEHSEGLNVLDFCQGLDDGLESLDNFLHYVVGELEHKNQ